VAAHFHPVLRGTLTLALLLGTPFVQANEATEVELYFELKLLYRGQRSGRTLAVDDWAGGRLRMRESGDRVYRLLRPLEDPWTFRWYPALGEAKLGGAVWVADPSGDVYDQPAASLIPLAERKYREWWRDDRVRPTAPELPSFFARTENFWAEGHRLERRDPLHEDPVYPFHVLGDPRDRLRFAVNAGGAVIPGSVVETMTAPWLADGWAQSQAGREVSGYGFWESKRPHWEPRAYETLAAGLRLLGFSALPLDEAGAAPDTSSGEVDLLGEAAGVVCTLLPRFGGRLGWSGSPEIRLSPLVRNAEFLTLRGESAITPVGGWPAGSYTVFRYTRYDRRLGRIDQDELQLLVAGAGETELKLWIRIGHVRVGADPAAIKPASPPTDESSDRTSPEQPR